tara:strand:- start:3157 stop:3369 length:213 start_codon:yes stop_codon:yes gene_type:complete
MREEEKNQLINGLYSIRECMICELFQLDNETEDELIETGCIEMPTDEMLLCLEEAISIIEKLKKNKLGGL